MLSRNNRKSFTAGFAVEPAVNTKQDKFLEYLDIDRAGKEVQVPTLKGRRIIVVGAGPAGLVAARAAAVRGADVTVIEQAGDPRKKDPGYTNRSFNITLDNVGRQVLDDPRAYQGGIWLRGRAVHSMKGADRVVYAGYGTSSDAEFVSIPRPILRQNLVNLAEQVGVRMLFRTTVISADCERGEVICRTISGAQRTYEGDLIVFGDGLHSLVDNLPDFDTANNIQVWSEARSCVAASIEPQYVGDLSLNHLHFWHEANGQNFTVGIPNQDGSIALLIVSEFPDIEPNSYPFATVELAAARLRRDFPRLYKLAPQLAQQLPARRRTRFCYKSVSSYRVGVKGVIVGDAGCVVPPWAGYGANSAMYAAASLVNQLGTHPHDMEVALNTYETQQLQMARLLMSFVREQGDFLSKSVTTNPAGRSEASLGPIIARARRQTGRVKSAPATQRVTDHALVFAR
jgi:2-polyprenyl-6-methoxyphenol hydroxylase-like FAD-dependent oxidoreductase